MERTSGRGPERHAAGSGANYKSTKRARGRQCTVRLAPTGEAAGEICIFRVASQWTVHAHVKFLEHGQGVVTLTCGATSRACRAVLAATTLSSSRPMQGRLILDIKGSLGLFQRERETAAAL